MESLSLKEPSEDLIKRANAETLDDAFIKLTGEELIDEELVAVED
jgi:hypothetical protein